MTDVIGVHAIFGTLLDFSVFKACPHYLLRFFCYRGFPRRRRCSTQWRTGHRAHGKAGRYRFRSLPASGMISPSLIMKKQGADGVHQQYFTLSGLSTDLGLLNNGITWGFTIAICVLAYSGKFGGCTIAARFAGFSWREASTIGSLMSCKGYVSTSVQMNMQGN